ncbi:hypothetical protein PC116_g10908 [Phytophthora cactorum]|uniref:Uncharacterized protein n=1 Tax=Phytophthora cactorum TaxID=29920 RepID=A0A8T1L1E5_9STRA|nr:hypothetical protein PC111_g7200 [Phytophthora cactorum]KAG2914834.1 hypothetical protein PC114_g8012 [Phytophthora cactorum]KAG2945977.1 hypothetical protein PC117_g7999 [Phytophthora cactorum]KAG3026833.1 hypothetical protein PC119_g7622 [Phytophthora cactorum]KAG3177353.1 hypothetical protein C6341_g8503 [Phytophthora cactorum]
MAHRGRRSGVSQLIDSGSAVVESRNLRFKRHLDVRRGLSGFHDLRPLIAQLLL